MSTSVLGSRPHIVGNPWRDLDARRQPAHMSSRSWTGLVRRMALAVLAGSLLFAHGCHGDEDNELFATVRYLGQQLPRPALTPAADAPPGAPAG